MNIFKKMFCRVYQTAFYVALPILPYREPEILHGVEELPGLLAAKNLNRVLLVTDSVLRSTGVTKRLEELLSEAQIHCAVYDKTRPNPTVQNVEEARELYVQENCQCLIAFGGGSSMDCAKAVGARVAYPKKSMKQLQGLLKVWKKIPTLVAIPTTAGTGSEVTVTAVITDEKKHHKYTMNNFTTIPHYALLDPEVTYTLPKSLTATTGMDALTHAVEAYIGRSTTKETRKYSLEAVKLIFANIETAYSEPTNRQARSNMLQAAYLAGEAFTKSYVGYIHAVAHSLGGQYNIPHGLANSVLMPIVLDAYGSAVYKKLHDLAVAAGIATAQEADETAAKRFIQAIRDMNSRMGIPGILEGIREEDIPVMAAHADREANPLYPVPVLMDAKVLAEFYREVAG